MASKTRESNPGQGQGSDGVQIRVDVNALRRSREQLNYTVNTVRFALENVLTATSQYVTSLDGIIAQGTGMPVMAPTFTATLGGTKRKREADPYAPKRPKTAFFLYLHKTRPEIGKELMRKGFPAGAKEVTEIATQRWNGLSEEEKAAYKQEWRQNFALYQAKADAYNAGLPIPDDGIILESIAQAEALKEAERKRIEAPAKLPVVLATRDLKKHVASDNESYATASTGEDAETSTSSEAPKPEAHYRSPTPAPKRQKHRCPSVSQNLSSMNISIPKIKTPAGSPKKDNDNERARKSGSVSPEKGKNRKERRKSKAGLEVTTADTAASVSIASRQIQVPFTPSKDVASTDRKEKRKSPEKAAKTPGSEKHKHKEEKKEKKKRKSLGGAAEQRK